MNKSLSSNGLSIVIPTYNRATTIFNAVLSVINDVQWLENWEVIVVDDNSSDNSLKIIDTLDVKVIRFDANMGANFARNEGCKQAKFEWIAFHDSDDLWLPGKTAAFAQHFDKAEFIFSSIVQLNDENLNLFPKTPKSISANFFQKRILSRSFISTQTLMVRKKVIDELNGFDSDMPRFQDWELSIRLFQKSQGVYIREPWSLSKIGRDSITKNYMAGIKARRLILKKHRSLYKQHGYMHFLFIRDLILRLIFIPLKK